MEKQQSLQNDLVEGEIFTQDELAATKVYNTKVTELDDLYTSITPLTGVVVRVFLNEPTISENGLLIPHKQTVPVSTPNGAGTMMEIESPYPYSNKAIVVATPSHSSLLAPGDIVQLNSNHVRAQTQGAGKNATISVPCAYVHPAKGDTRVPIDSTNRHYGYLIVPLHEIIVKL